MGTTCPALFTNTRVLGGINRIQEPGILKGHSVRVPFFLVRLLFHTSSPITPAGLFHLVEALNYLTNNTIFE